MLNITNEPHSCQNGYFLKRQKIPNVDEDAERRESFHTVGTNVNWYSNYENSMEVPKKFKNIATL